MDTTKVILGVIAAGSIILNILFWYNPNLMNTNCYSTQGFQTPVKVGKVTAKRYADDYVNNPTTGPILTGGIITRSAFDEMMCIEGCNAISYTLGRERDAAGNLTGIIVIFNGVNAQNVGGRYVGNDIGTGFYISRNWCPPNCYPW